MTTASNNSKYYYVSNQNMSGIKESIEEYSMDFEGVSGTGSEIAEMISASHQASQSRQSKFYPKSKPALPKPEIIEQENNYQADNNQGQNNKKGIYLGDQVFNIIKERYFETNKITTDDPEVLYDFFVGQRKNLKSMKPITEKDIQKQMPSMQRKLLIKQKFQTILTYYPDDVYYSLCYFKQKQDIDKKTNRNVEILKRETKKQMKKKVTNQQLNTIVEKLYKNKNNKNEEQKKQNSLPTKEEVEKRKRVEFGRNLSEHFQNTFRNRGYPANVQTVEKLYNFWSDIYEREEYKIEWDEDTAMQTIERYMYEQIDDLMKYGKNKLGFKCTKAESIFKFYRENQEKVQRFIFIPLQSFHEYAKVYNKVEMQYLHQEESQWQKKQKQHVLKQKKKEVKQFGRPVSATPLTILSQPKNTSLAKQKNQLCQKYPNNRIVKQMKLQETLKRNKYPFQYGVYDLVEELKTKDWVKPKKRENTIHEEMVTNKIIQNRLTHTFSQGEGNWSSVQRENDRLTHLFAEEQLAQDQHWKNLGPVMHEAMLVKGYQHRWFVECIVKYLERVLGEKDLKYQDNSSLFRKLFNYLTHQLDQNSRNSELSKLETYILTSQSIAEKTNQINKISNDPKAYANTIKKQRRLVNAVLEDKAIEWVKMRSKKKEGQNKMLTNFLKEIYQELMKEHKQYMIKEFHIVQGSKEVPKLLKYELFRQIKLVNPLTLEKERDVRSYAWVPTKTHPQKMNYKTFNNITQIRKPKNSVTNQQGKGFQRQLWGFQNQKDRELFFMNYQDAKECTYHYRKHKEVK